MTAHPLASSLDLGAAVPLRQELLTRIEGRQPILLDGSEVARVGQACLQVLAGARAAAEAAELRFAVLDPSAELRAMVALARLDTLLQPMAEGHDR